MTFTTLDIVTQVNAILDRYDQPMKQAIQQDNLTGSKLLQSKQAGQCTVEIRNEMNRQGAIYIKEEEDAIASLTRYHEGTKAFYKQCELLIGQLEKQWDDKKAQDLINMAAGIKSAVREIAAIRKGMTAHQGFRAGYCSEPKCTAVLTERTYTELYNYFIGIRAPLIPKLAALSDKDQKSIEHGERVDGMIKLLPTYKKDAQSGDTVVAGIREDAKKVADLKLLVTGSIVSKTGSVKNNIYTPCKNHAKTPCSADLVKGMNTALADHETRYKETKSKLKTVEQLKDSVVKRATAVKKEKDKEVLTLYKQMETDIKEMGKLLDTYDSERKKAAEELKKVSEALAKKK